MARSALAANRTHLPLPHEKRYARINGPARYSCSCRHPAPESLSTQASISHFMTTLFTAEAISKGGRSGIIQTPDALLDITLGNPLEPGIEKRGPNPELLFAAAYAACYNGALIHASETLGTPTTESMVTAKVSLIEEDQGGYRLAVELHATLPGFDSTYAQRVMEEAHRTCPYSKALRGDTAVTLVVD